MEILKTIVTILYVIDCIALVIIVLMQEGKSGGLQALAGGNDTYWSKNKGRSTEGALIKVTRTLAALFILLTIALIGKWF